MRAMLLPAGAVSLAWALSAAAGQFPYTAYVQVDLASVHSGPGPDFYATEGLVRGSKVEVYRHDTGGWYAIRPPEGSFSWVEQAKLQPTDDPGVAKVAGEKVLSYVGTRFGDDHDVQHVHLRPGELVEVLGQSTLAGTPGSPGTVWTKIAPPAGEFRWIDSRDIARKLPSRPLEDGPVDGLAAEGAADGQAWAPADVKHFQYTSPDDRVRVVSHEPASELSPNPAPQSTAEPAVGDAASKSRADQARAVAADSHGGSLAFRDASRHFDRDDPISQELDAIDLDLSLTVVREPGLWDLDDLRSRVEAVIDTCDHASQRDRARDLLGTIIQFEDIRRRHQQLGGIGQGWVDPGMVQRSPLARPVAAVLSPPSATARLGPGAGDVPFDGSGWLMPVFAQRRGVPRYALTDRDGRILQFVSPSPGVNLRRYERVEVGVIGRRGYVPHLQTPHLTAQRVVVLNRHRR